MRVFGLLAMLWLALAGAVANAQTPLSPTQFRDHVLAKAKAQRHTLEFEITGPLSAKASTNETKLNLESGYGEYLNDPSQLDAITRKWVQMLAMLVDGAETDTSDLNFRIVQVVRNRQYLDQVAGQAKDAADLEKSFLSRPLAGDLIVVLMANYENMMGVVGTDLLAKANISTTEAWKLAAQNTSAQLGELKVGSYGQDGPVAITADSALATGLLVEPDACTKGPLSQDAVVLVVDRNTFLIGRPSDKETIGAFWEFAREAARDGSYASSTPITCKSGKWVETSAPR